MQRPEDGLPTDWWTTGDVVAYLSAANGRPVAAATWRAYVHRERRAWSGLSKPAATQAY